ncbi:hypothetical protein CKO36_14530 [Rhabdochromatium marinum]|nr:hypothetical protein [Rhabdochromatium marinum]
MEMDSIARFYFISRLSYQNNSCARPFIFRVDSNIVSAIWALPSITNFFVFKLAFTVEAFVPFFRESVHFPHSAHTSLLLLPNAAFSGLSAAMLC